MLTKKETTVCTGLMIKQSVVEACSPIQPIQGGLSLRKPFNIFDYFNVCLYSLNILIGSVGNALVVEYFASGDASNSPGSTFIIF